MQDFNRLFSKYPQSAPRYTSYPTVPYWDEDGFNEFDWKLRLTQSVSEDSGISLYIHLPYCEQLCTYCGCNTRITVNHEVERPYIETLWKELDLYLDFLPAGIHIKELHLGGGTPTFFSALHLKELLEGIRIRLPFAEDAALSFEGHPNNTTKEHLNELYQQGFRRVSFGIQDLDPEVQIAINRIQPIANVRRVTEEARAIGYHSVNFDLVYGLPFQSEAGLEKTLSSVLSLRPDRIAFYSYAHVPWLKPGQRRYSEKDLPDTTTRLALHEMGRKAFLEAGYTDIGMDHFALPGESLYNAAMAGTMHRNFMGYTDTHTQTMLGIGVSSISDCGLAFAQNHKTVEAYIESVSQGALPVFRGHLLNEEDLRIRQFILELMCRKQVNLENAIGLVDENTKSSLNEFVQDGLAVWEGDCFKVLGEGNRFLRQMAMCLDLRLKNNKSGHTQFSATA
jgi:oxygen-independent coproporphyrinogen III oxidase